MKTIQVTFLFLLLMCFASCGSDSTEETTEPVESEQVQAPMERTPASEPEAGQTDEDEVTTRMKEADKSPEPKAQGSTDRAETSRTAPKPADKPKTTAGPHPGLNDPGQANEQAPAQFKVKFVTTRGDFIVQAQRAWAPRGADRLYNLVRVGYFTDIAFFRVIDGFMVQFGIHGNPGIAAAWKSASIQDDPVQQSNARGFLTFATAGPNTRTTQLFINFGNNAALDRQGFSPVGQVIEGMDVVDSIYKGYGEGAPRGRGPSQGLIQSQGNTYLKANFPNLDYIKSAHIVD